MDSTSQTSAADDFINEFGRSCSCSTLSDTTFGVSTSTGCCAKESVDKLLAKLEKKDEQYKEDIKELLANLNLEKVRAVQVQATPGTDELKKELTIAQKTITALQMAFWKSFPSPHLCYHIKVKAPSGNGEEGYLYADYNGYMCLSTDDDDDKGYFRFEKDSDGAYSIYSKSKAKFLQIQTSSYAMFRGNEDNKSKFALIFHPQQDKPQSGIFVDIFALANGCFLSADEGNQQQNRLVANSLTASPNKFLLLAEGVA